MEHKTIKAAATATDQGEFTAIAAAYTVDRMDEQIQQGAFEKTITRWQESGKNIPLHWDHSGKPQDIIGVVHPNEMREADEGLYVKGQLDLEGSEVAREAWRLMKSNSIGLSFGYLVNDSTEDDGLKTLTDLDVFEISITPAPVNPDTRVIEMKSYLDAEKNRPPLEPDGVVTVLTEEENRAIKDLRAGKVTITKNTTDPKPIEADALTAEEARQLKSGYDKVALDLMAVGVNADDKAKPPESPDLSDSAFLHIERGGVKDAEGKTAPRSLRYFAVKDASGVVDTSCLRFALARIPHSNLDKDVKDRLTEKAQAMLDKAIEEAATEEPDESPAKLAAIDPLRKAHDEIALDLMTRGIAPAEPPQVEEEPEPEDPPSLEDLRRKHFELTLESLIGSENP